MFVAAFEAKLNDRSELDHRVERDVAGVDDFLVIEGFWSEFSPSVAGDGAHILYPLGVLAQNLAEPERNRLSVGSGGGAVNPRKFGRVNAPNLVIAFFQAQVGVVPDERMDL